MSLPADNPTALLTGLTFVAAMIACWGLTLIALRRQRFAGVLDEPNERSLHESPVPRIGGVLMMQAIAVVAISLAIWVGFFRRCPTDYNCLLPGQSLSDALPTATALLIGTALLVWIGRLDDRGSLSVAPRLLIHLGCAAMIGFAVTPSAASSLITSSGLVANLPHWFITALLFLFITLGVAWLTNLYNFMDGANGLAGLMTLIGFGTYALIAPAGSVTGIVSAACSGAALGFLLFNWDPARIFMGDAGSIPLGFLAAALGLAGAQAGYWSWLLPLGIFLPFIFDATTTLALRAWRGEPITAAHRSHAYQILVMMGLGHHNTAIIFGGLMVICSLTSATSSYLTDPVKWAVWAVIILTHVGVVAAARSKS